MKTLIQSQIRNTRPGFWAAAGFTLLMLCLMVSGTMAFDDEQRLTAAKAEIDNWGIAERNPNWLRDEG